MKAEVIKPYKRPYENPMAVPAGAKVTPDIEKTTEIAGWVWCTAEDSRSGWTPKAWLAQRNGMWILNRDFNAIELTITPGEILEIEFGESGFYWASRESGESGWVPCDHVAPIQETER